MRENVDSALGEQASSTAAAPAGFHWPPLRNSAAVVAAASLSILLVGGYRAAAIFAAASLSILLISGYRAAAVVAAAPTEVNRGKPLLDTRVNNVIWVAELPAAVI